MPLPTTTILNGTPIDWNDMATAPLPFAPGWDFRLATHGPVALWEFRVGSRPVHRAIVNGCRDMAAPPLKLRHDGELDLLGSLEGHLWTDDGVSALPNGFNVEHGILDLLSPVESNPFDGHFGKDLWFADVMSTKDTGSGGIERFLPEAMVCLKHGASPAAYRWFSKYAEIQFRRKRWVLGPNGLPDGLGRDVAPIPGFSEWYSLSDDGLNPGDAQHADVDELYWGWRLFRDPMFLVALIQAWTTFRWQFESWRNPAASKELYVGSIRTPAYLLKATALLIDALRGIPALEALRLQAVQFAQKHLTIVEEAWPIFTIYGSVPPEMRNADNTAAKPHTKPWMDSMLALGLQYLERALARGYVMTPPDALRCLALSERICGWLDAECWDGDKGLFCDVLAQDGTKHWIPLGLGTALWPSSALHWSPKARAITAAMASFFEDIGANNPQSKYHLGWYIGSVPTLAGYDTGLEVEGFAPKGGEA